jgi:copper chaperone CopZ
MKMFQKILLVAVVASIPAMMAGQQKNTSIQTVKFSTSIDCDDCVNTIMNSLPREKGVKDVKCDLKTKEVTVKYLPEKTNTEEVRRKIEKLGYVAKPVKEKEGVPAAVKRD